MRPYLLFALLMSTVVAQAAVEWAAAPGAYKLSPDGSIEARDGGQSTGDQYLLTARDYQDFVLEFDAERIAEVAEQPRSILVWAVDSSTPANRKALFMDFAALRPQQRAHVRLVVFGAQAAVYVDGRAVSTSPIVYGAPPLSGKVGFLHYYNYGYRYSNVELTSLDSTALAAPHSLKGRLGPGGVLELAWDMAAPFTNVVSYRVYRTAGGARAAAGERSLLGQTEGLSFADASLRSGSVVSYLVAAVGADGADGPPSRPFVLRVPRLRPPAAPSQVTAVRRLDGTVRVRWQFLAGSRYEGVRVFRGLTEAEVLGEGAQPIAAKLPPRATDFLAAPGTGEYVAVEALDPDGRPAPRTAAAITTAAPPLAGGAGVPASHPYLLYDAVQIARARRLMATEDWARDLAVARRRAADAAVGKPAEIPQEPTDGQSSVSGRLLDVALAYQLFGDEKHAQWVRDALVAYARVYPKLPALTGRVRLFKTVSGLYEAMWFVPLVCAYDLVYESPAFSAEDHDLIQRDLIRLGAELFWVKDYNDPQDNRPADLHYKCYNFQAWFDAAVGLAGLLLKDADMVEHALDGPYGLKHLLAHDVHDDGVFWERSLGYHGFVLEALFPLLQAGTHCNLDLWHVAVPDDYNTDREPLANYTVGDGDNGPKSLRQMLDGPFYFTFPDLTWPVVADSGAGPLSAQNWYRAGWERYHDQKYAWLLNREPAAIGGPAWTGVPDTGAQVRLAYDDGNLYVSALVSDQVVRNSHADPDNAWAGDALWVGLKWTGDRGGPYDFIYGLTTGDGDQVAPVPALFTRFGLPVNQRSAAQLSVTRTETGYDLEAAIPLSELAPRAGEAGTPLAPAAGLRIAADFVLYDSDQRSGATTKEKMLGWACVTDRYDSAQGGTVVFGPVVPEADEVINAPSASTVVVDGRLDEWEAPPAMAARLGEGSAVMYDAAASGPSMADLFYERPPAGTGAFDLRGDKFANNGVLEAGCSLFPSTGFALLRDRLGEDGLAPADATAVNLTYGPYGGGHGHPDKLSLVLYAQQTHLIPDFGSCGYDSPEKSQWTAQTIGHNTVTVDETSQLPADGTQSTWPCDTAEQQARGFLECFHGDPLLKAVQAWDTSTYPGVEQRRTVALLGDTVFDFFQLTSAAKHTYDYALHVALPLQSASQALTALPDPLGDKLGYQHIHQARQSEPTGELLQTAWAEGDKALLLTMAPAPETRLIVAESITTSLDRLMPMQIVRREAAATTFATIMQPLPPGAEQPPWQWISGTGCLAATDGAAGFVAWSPTPAKLARAGDMAFTGLMAARGAEGLSLVAGRLLEAGGVRLQASQPVSAYVRLEAGRPVEVGLGYQSEARLTITWRGHARQLDGKPRQTYELTLP